MTGMGGALSAGVFWIFIIVPVGFFAIVLLLGFWDNSEEEHEGPEVDLDGEAGPPPPA